MSTRQGFWMNTKTFEQIPVNYRLWCSPDAFDRALRPRVLDIKINFEAHLLDLDHRVINSRSEFIKNLNTMINANFTNKTIIEQADPDLDIFQQLHNRGLLDIVVVPNSVGVENFAHGIYHWVKVYLIDSGLISRVDIRTVDILEDAGNSAVYVE